ncbi:hypothetical protein [Psychrosphaera aestuarii]|uniref:hypothetical protein n=1 Tax=Psychrosphaera aestuarii TaxID=1266052 RepID=UPI001B335B16|nr:hypothetical protein [Psychrosphaera aestuarii]
MANFNDVASPEAFSDGNTQITKSDAENRNRQTKHDLISLATANSYQIRVLAVKNLKYYPEHIDILIALLRTESHAEVLAEIESSIVSLLAEDSITACIEEKLQTMMEKLVEGEPAFYICRSLLNNYNDT